MFLFSQFKRGFQLLYFYYSQVRIVYLGVFFSIIQSSFILYIASILALQAFIEKVQRITTTLEKVNRVYFYIFIRISLPSSIIIIIRTTLFTYFFINAIIISFVTLYTRFLKALNRLSSFSFRSISISFSSLILIIIRLSFVLSSLARKRESGYSRRLGYSRQEPVQFRVALLYYQPFRPSYGILSASTRFPALFNLVSSFLVSLSLSRTILSIPRSQLERPRLIPILLNSRPPFEAIESRQLLYFLLSSFSASYPRYPKLPEALAVLNLVITTRRFVYPLLSYLPLYYLYNYQLYYPLLLVYLLVLARSYVYIALDTLARLQSLSFFFPMFDLQYLLYIL